MNEPMILWVPIEPVEEQPVPAGTQVRWCSDSDWLTAECSVFENGCHQLQWRVPVEVVPIYVAVTAICETAYGYDDCFCVSLLPNNKCDLVASSLEELRELVIAKLRELSQEKTNVGKG